MTTLTRDELGPIEHDPDAPTAEDRADYARMLAEDPDPAPEPADALAYFTDLADRLNDGTHCGYLASRAVRELAVDVRRHSTPGMPITAATYEDRKDALARDRRHGC